MMDAHTGQAFTDFIFLFILMSVGFYSYQFRYRRKETLLIFRSVYDTNAAEQLFRENSRLINRSLYTLLFTSLVLLGVFVTWWMAFANILPQIGIPHLLIGVLAAGLGFAFRYTSLHLLGVIGNAEDVIDQIIFNLKTLLALLGFILLPLLTFAVFSSGGMAPVSAKCGIVAIGLTLPLFLFKGSVISFRSSQIKTLHLFYYFCALEIMPLIWAYRSLLN